MLKFSLELDVFGLAAILSAAGGDVNRRIEGVTFVTLSQSRWLVVFWIGPLRNWRELWL